ncbi:MAG: DUF2934 domain-containing protein [Candidatus Acidiferrales bacterium]
MNETKGLIAQRAYEIFESRGREHGADQDDWFSAEGEILPRFSVKYHVTGDAIQFTTAVPGFDASDLEVEIGHRRAVVCGVHPDLKQAEGHRKNKRAMRIVELPFDVDPAAARATLQSGTLEVVLPRLR